MKRHNWEEQTQGAVYAYVGHQPYRDHWFHVPNERSHKIQRMLLSRLGVRAGVPDNMLLWPRGHFHGAAMELKADRPNNSALSPRQRKWLVDLDRVGYYCGHCIGVDEAIAFLDAYWKQYGEIEAWAAPWTRYKRSAGVKYF